MRAILSLLVAAVLCPSALAQATAGSQKREATYKGKPLAYWVERLQKAETDKDQSDAADAIVAFGADAAPAARTLAGLLDDHSFEYCFMILQTLAKLGPNAREATPQLVKVLKEILAFKMKETDARYDMYTDRILSTLAVVADPKDAVPALVTALAQPVVRAGAVVAICTMGPAAKGAIPDIRRAISTPANGHDENRDTYRVLLFEKEVGLHKLGPDVLPLLWDILELSSLDAKQYAIQEIVKLAPDKTKVLPKFKSLLQDKEPWVRFHVSVALWDLDKTKAAVPVLTRLLTENDEVLVRCAVAELGEIGPDAREALPALKATLGRKWPVMGSVDSLSVSVELSDRVQTAIEKIDLKHKK